MTPFDIFSFDVMLKLLFGLIIMIIIFKLIIPNLGDLKSTGRRKMHYHRESNLYKEPIINMTDSVSSSLIKFVVMIGIGVIGIVVAMEYGVI